MFKVKLEITLYGDRFYGAEKETCLPFVPFIGLEYKNFGKIEHVRWMGLEFVCELDTQPYFQGLVELFEKDGWTVKRGKRR